MNTSRTSVAGSRSLACSRPERGGPPGPGPTALLALFLALQLAAPLAGAPEIPPDAPGVAGTRTPASPAPAPAAPSPGALRQAAERQYAGYRLSLGDPAAPVHGDLDGNGHEDVVTFLVRDDDWVLVAFLQDPAGGLTAHELDGFPGSDREWKARHRPGDLTLQILAAGRELTLLGQPVIGSATPRNSVLLIPVPEEGYVLRYQWDATYRLFGVSQIHHRE